MDEITLMCSDAMNQGYEEGLREGERLFKPKWIEVEKELPEHFRAVLIWADYIGTSHVAEITTIGTWQKDHWSTDRDGDYDKVEIHVRKWMYIPD